MIDGTTYNGDWVDDKQHGVIKLYDIEKGIE